ncbi:MAG: formylmethanofuran dehydrogenase subunit A [Gemmatimonadales bacterium]|jgi:formylmethanofuran dehydrogenase subunit A
MSGLRIMGGTIHDPANNIDGEVRDICVLNGRIVASLPDDAPRLDARDMVVMPGGIDIHAHVASASTNVARRMLPEDHAMDPARAPSLVRDRDADITIPRSGSGGTVPSTFTTGYRYAGLGYTTVFDAAVAPVSARDTHAQFDDTPIIDTGCYILMGNDAYLHRQIADGEHERARDYVAWLLRTTKGYAVKIVNPGGIELWKRNVREVTSLDDAAGDPKVTPRTILETLAGAANALNLPHPVHIHCNNLGMAGNVGTTLDSMRTLSGRRAHFTHLQFQSYAGERGKSWASGAKQISEYMAAHPETSGDVGQVMFGQACTLTADGAVEYLLHTSSGRKWTNIDIELETGCGVVPYTYREKAAVASLQWVVGLELFLLSGDPWRLVLSTDHPNGGSFMSYPQLIHLLMDRSFRDEQIKRINPKMLAGSALADGLSREYTLNEIAIITRAGPARLLGLSNKGHLGVGADADITIYTRDADRSRMFATPRYVLKAGTLVVEEGQLRRAPQGRRHQSSPAYDPAVERDIKQYFGRYLSVAFENYGA